MDDIECPKCGHKHFVLMSISLDTSYEVEVERKCYNFECGHILKIKLVKPYHLCNTHLRTWRASYSTEDSQRARLTNNKDK